MEGKVKLIGLEEAMKALQAAFPDNFKKQSQLINGAMGGSARQSFLPIAKQMAKNGDSSGALSEALGVRAQKARNRKGKAGGMQVVPVRSNRKAMAMYIQFYYTNKGVNAPANILEHGIRHGHLIEFGHMARGGKGHVAAKPFMWPSTVATPKYRSLFAGELKKRIESNVRRAAKRAKK